MYNITLIFFLVTTATAHAVADEGVLSCPVGAGVAITPDLLALTGAPGGRLPRVRVPCRRCGHRRGAD